MYRGWGLLINAYVCICMWYPLHTIFSGASLVIISNNRIWCISDYDIKLLVCFLKEFCTIASVEGQFWVAKSASQRGSIGFAGFYYLLEKNYENSVILKKIDNEKNKNKEHILLALHEKGSNLHSSFISVWFIKFLYILSLAKQF